MLDFTAIDFETANKYANSACSLAAVTMHDGHCCTYPSCLPRSR